MKRDPFAKALRVKPQQVISDKREKTYREHLDDTINEGVPDWATELLNELEGAAAFEAARTTGASKALTDSGPSGEGANAYRDSAPPSPDSTLQSPVSSKLDCPAHISRDYDRPLWRRK